MPTVAENKTTLSNLLEDAADFADAMNTNATITPRTGAAFSSVPKLIADKGADLDTETANAANWAVHTGSLVPSAADYSSKEWAIGTFVPDGSSKDWAITPEDTLVDGDSGYSSLHYSAKAAASAAAAAASAASIQNTYLGPHANDDAAETYAGAELGEGDWYFNTTSNRVRIYDGALWDDAVSGVTASSTDVFTNKTINLTSNTLTGTVAQFNAAVSDGSFLVAGSDLSDLANAATARTNLGATTIGSTIFTAADAAAVLSELGVETNADVTDADNVSSALGSISIDALSDVDGSGATEGQVLTRSAGGEWVAGDAATTTTGFVSVEDYGVDLTGVTKDTTGVTNALAALVAQGGGVLYFPPGTYKRDDELAVTNSNIHIVHAPGAVIDCSNLAFTGGTRNSGCAISFEGVQAASTTLSSSASEGDTDIVVTSATSIAVGQLVYLYSTKVLQNNSGTTANYLDVNRVIGVSGTTITLEHPLHLDFSVSGETVTATFHTVLENVSVRGGEFQGGGQVANYGAGFGRTGIHAIRCRNVRVENVTLSGFQGTAFWSEYADTVRALNNNVDGVDAGDAIVDGENSGFTAFISVRSRNVDMSGNICARNRHVCDATNVVQITQSNNKGYSTHAAAYGSHQGVFGLEVTSNKAYNCYTGGTVRAFSSKWNNNEFLRCTTGGITTTVEASGDEPGRLELIGNTVKVLDDAGTSASALAVDGYYDPLIIKTNDMESQGGRVILLSPRNILNLTASSNRLKTTYATSSVCIQFDAQEEGMTNVTIEDNDCIGFTLNAIRMSGCEDISNAADNISVKGNRCYAGGNSGNAVFLVADGGWWGDNIEIIDNWQNNDTSECAAWDTAPAGRFRSAPTFENNVNFVDADGTQARPRHVVGYSTSSELNGDATLLPGDVILNNRPTGTDPIEWHCTTAGTEGSVAAITGSVTSGSPTLTLTGNDGAKVYPGCYISVSGAFSRVRVVSLSSDYATATMDSNASGTVSGVAVIRANPIIAAGPQLGAT